MLPHSDHCCRLRFASDTERTNFFCGFAERAEERGDSGTEERGDGGGKRPEKGKDRGTQIENSLKHGHFGNLATARGSNWGFTLFHPTYLPVPDLVGDVSRLSTRVVREVNELPDVGCAGESSLVMASCWIDGSLGEELCLGAGVLGAEAWARTQKSHGSMDLSKFKRTEPFGADRGAQSPTCIQTKDQKDLSERGHIILHHDRPFATEPCIADPDIDTELCAERCPAAEYECRGVGDADGEYEYDDAHELVDARGIPSSSQSYVDSRIFLGGGRSTVTLPIGRGVGLGFDFGFAGPLVVGLPRGRYRHAKGDVFGRVAEGGRSEEGRSDGVLADTEGKSSSNGAGATSGKSSPTPSPSPSPTPAASTSTLNVRVASSLKDQHKRSARMTNTYQDATHTPSHADSASACARGARMRRSRLRSLGGRGFCM
ncbi:hypothetical protein B0H14DRAFT_3556076 [Mycena olivaceomarginata]|nr:hypothetical protein B0H14DRAFT_3556076 [Mycena olivaceomarginata]